MAGTESWHLLPLLKSNGSPDRAAPPREEARGNAECASAEADCEIEFIRHFSPARVSGRRQAAGAL